jgi:hypothetical protein
MKTGVFVTPRRILILGRTEYVCVPFSTTLVLSVPLETELNHPCR